MAGPGNPKMPPTDDRKPSEVTNVYWLSATRQEGEYPAHTEMGGKWLIFVPISQVDEVWARIKSATERGLLGQVAKVATSMPNPNAASPDKRVICVYTYDWTDETDVRRIREQLR